MNRKTLTGQSGLLLGIVIIAAIAILWSNRPLNHHPKQGGQKTVGVLVMAKADGKMVLGAKANIPAGGSALDALEDAAFQQAVPLGIKEYPFGKLVVSIGEYTAGPDGDWTYRVNDTMVPVAANAVTMHEGDRLMFRFGHAEADSLKAAGDSI